MKVLVTGSTGFIGSHVVELLLHHHYEVKVLCRSAHLAHRMFADRIEIASGDMRNRDAIFHAARDCHAAIHLAGYAKNWARDPALFDRVNVTGTTHLLDAALAGQFRKVVVTSTNLTIPPSRDGRCSDETAAPLDHYVNSYQGSKCRMEKRIAAYARRGLPVVMVNPTRVFGPGLLSEANSVTKMIQQYLAGSWRMILGDGLARGNYAFVADVAQGHLLALQHGKSGERYLLGGANLGFIEFFAVLADVSGKTRKMFHVPAKMAFAIAGVSQFLAEHLAIHPLITPDWVATFMANWEISNDKAIRELGYRVTPFPLALEKTIHWLTQNKQGEGSDENDYPLPESRPVL